MESLIFLTDNCDTTIKRKYCANLSIQRDWMNKKLVSSLTVALEKVICTSVIYYHEYREVVMVDIENEFIQNDNTKKWEIKYIL